MKRTITAFTLTLCGVLALGCADKPGDSCTLAEQHLESCLGPGPAVTEFANSCTPEIGDQVSRASCEDLQALSTSRADEAAGDDYPCGKPLSKWGKYGWRCSAMHDLSTKVYCSGSGKWYTKEEAENLAMAACEAEDPYYQKGDDEVPDVTTCVAKCY